MPPPESERPFRGYIQVYTGNGKGKTTAALGLALRAAGWRLRTYIGQFLKGQSYGELASLGALAPYVTVEQFGRSGFLTIDHDIDDDDAERARHGLEKCRQALGSGVYDIVILDEVSVAVHFKLLTEKDILDLMDAKPDAVELILTGRYAPASWLERADLVTDMVEVKHYYARGVRARRGIEK
jgi:cob(I)alamin adenosyltransferase